MTEYTHEQLHELLDLYTSPYSALSTTQKQALIDWHETPEDVGAQLRADLAKNPPPPGAAPLRPQEEDYLRERGPTDEPAGNSEPLPSSWLDRLRGFFRGSDGAGTN